MLARAASRSTASVKVRCSICSTKRMTSPPAPQPKQWKTPRDGRHRQRRRLLVVERADALEVAAAGVAQLDVLADHVVDRGLLAHQGDVLVADPSWHSESRGLTATSPSAAAADEAGVPGDGGRVGQLGDLVDDDPQPGRVVRRARPRRPPAPGRACAGAPASTASTSSVSSSPLGRQPLVRAGPAHHVVGRDRLEQRALGRDRRRDHQVGVVAAQRPAVARPGSRPPPRRRSARSARWWPAWPRPGRRTSRRSRPGP